MSKKWVALLPNSKLPFRRAKRDKDGNVVSVLRFKQDAPLELDDEEYELVRRDIGKTLCICEPIKSDPGRFRVDWDATNDQHKDEFGTLMTRPSRYINAGAGQTPKNVEEESPSGDEDSDNGSGEPVEISDELADLLEKHAETLPDPLTPESLAAWIGDGNRLVGLEGFTDEFVTELYKSLGLDPPEPAGDDNPTPTVTDTSKLTEAGVSKDLADVMHKNAGDHPWILDPDAVKAKVADGFDLTTLDDVGNGRAKQIRTALGIAE